VTGSGTSLPYLSLTTVTEPREVRPFLNLQTSHPLTSESCRHAAF
jgi:hypothetical protein